MSSSGMLRHEALVRTDVSEELSSYFIRVIRIDEVGTTLATDAGYEEIRNEQRASAAS
jgi:hypothetical protein